MPPLLLVFLASIVTMGFSARNTRAGYTAIHQAEVAQMKGRDYDPLKLSNVQRCAACELFNKENDNWGHDMYIKWHCVDFVGENGLNCKTPTVARETVTPVKSVEKWSDHE